MTLSNQVIRLSVASAFTLILSGGAFAMDFLEECKSRSAGSFFAEVPAQCLFHPSSRTYAYKGVDCFSCKRISIISNGNGDINRGGGGSDTPGTNGGGNPSDDPGDGGGPGLSGS